MLKQDKGTTSCLTQPYRNESDLQPVLDQLLSRSLTLTGAALGNVQLMDWGTGNLTIAAQHGFNDRFLSLFHRVNARDGCACGRAIRKRSAVVISDVLLDPEFEPYREIALEAGFRGVQSTPLISSSGAFLGMLSTHFTARHSPSDHEMWELRMAGELAANAIIRLRVLSCLGYQALEHEENERISTARAAVERSYSLLRRSDPGRNHWLW